MLRTWLAAFILAVPGCAGTCSSIGNDPVSANNRTLPMGDSPTSPRDPSVPFPLSGLVARYDVAEDPGNDGDGATIEDMVGTRDFSSISGTITLQVDAVSGERWWECDGTDHYETGAPSTLTQTKTMCMVFGATSTASAAIPWDAASGDRSYIYLSAGGSGQIHTASDSVFIGTFRNSPGRYHVACGYYDGASSRWRVGGTEATGNPGSKFSSSFSLCARGIGISQFSGRVKEAAVWDGDVVADAEAHFADKYGGLLFPFCTGIGRDDCPLTQYTVTAAGDSITLGTPYATTPYPDQLDTLLGGTWVVTNRGVGSSTIDTGIENWELTYRHDLDHWLIIKYGVNDIVADEAATSIYADLTALIDDAQTYGMKTILVTVSPWKASGGWSSARQAETDALNALIVADSNADAVCNDYPLLEDLTNADELRASYDSGDGIHPNDTGLGVIAQCVYDAMATVPGGP